MLESEGLRPLSHFHEAVQKSILAANFSHYSGESRRPNSLRGTVALTDPVAKYLLTSVKMPERGGRESMLQDLATHKSGLTRLPSNLIPRITRFCFN